MDNWLNALERVLEYRLLVTDLENFGGYMWVYVPFNMLEGLLWWALAVFVLWRYGRNRKTPYELLYALSFVVFGLTDYIEVVMCPVWLLVLKAMCLVGILLGRKLVIGHYEGAKL